MKGMKNIKRYVLMILLFILLTNCKNFFYGATRNMRYVYDYNYWQDGIPSYQVNTNDRYCMFIYNNDQSIRNIIISFLKNNDVIFELEPPFEYNGKARLPKEIIGPIKQREIDNNFKNCDYLLSFHLTNGIENKKSIYLDIDIYDIKTDKRIGTYTMHEDDTIFNKKTQEQKVEKMLNEWWETQIKPQPKARPLETWCVGNCDNEL